MQEVGAAQGKRLATLEAELERTRERLLSAEAELAAERERRRVAEGEVAGAEARQVTRERPNARTPERPNARKAGAGVRKLDILKAEARAWQASRPIPPQL
eukprot:1431508-Prymnesium_polylepis.1